MINWRAWLIAPGAAADNAGSNGDSLSATIIRLRGAASVETPAPLRATLHTRFPASVTGAVRRWWRRARLAVEALGWIIVAASIIAAVKP
jgi:hypothetical protein